MHKKRLARTIVFTMLLLVAVAEVFLYFHESENVAYIGSVPICKREFDLVLDSSKAKIISMFDSKHANTFDKNFWQTHVEGQTPADALFEDALQTCVRNKTIEILAREYNIINDCSYNGVLKALSKENRIRKQKLAANEVVYGPNQYDEKSYYNYYILSIGKEIQRIMQKNAAEDDIKACKEYYEQIKDQYYKKVDKLVLIVIEFPAGHEYQSVERYYNKLRTSASLNISLTNELKKSDINYRSITIDEDSVRYFSLNSPEILKNALELSQNSLSDIIVSGGKYCILYCVDRESGGYNDFESVSDVVKVNFYEQKFDELVRQRINMQKLRTTQLYDSLKKNYKGG